MKKKTMDLRTEHLPPLMVFLDDLSKVVDILRSVSNTIDIETDEYTFDDLAELQKLDCERITNLSLESHNPSICVAFRPYGARITRYQKTPESIGAAKQIKDVLLRRRRRWAEVLNWARAMVPGLLVFLAVSLAGEGARNKSWIVIVAAVTLFIIAIACVWWIVAAEIRYKCVIVLQRSGDYKSFWTRHGDQIIVGTIMLAIGAFITLLVQAGTGLFNMSPP